MTARAIGSRIGPIILWTVVTVVGIAVLYVLVAFIQVYREREVRGRISQAIMASQPWMRAVEEHYRSAKRLPRDTNDLRGGAPKTTNRFGNVSLAGDGVLTITLSDEVGSPAGQTVILIPQASGDSLRWRCGSRSVRPYYLPGSCRDEIEAVGLGSMTR
jgi:hypothetical protein